MFNKGLVVKPRYLTCLKFVYFVTLTHIDSPATKSDTSKVEEEGESKKEEGEEVAPSDKVAPSGESSQSERADDSVTSTQGGWLTSYCHSQLTKTQCECTNNVINVDCTNICCGFIGLQTRSTCLYKNLEKF